MEGSVDTRDGSGFPQPEPDRSGADSVPTADKPLATGGRRLNPNVAKIRAEKYRQTRRKARELLSEKIEAILSGEAGTPQLAGIATRLMKRAGGQDEFADTIYKEFQKTEAGSLARAKILDQIMRLIKTAAEQEQKREDLGLIEERDIEAKIIWYLKRIITSESRKKNAGNDQQENQRGIRGHRNDTEKTPERDRTPQPESAELQGVQGDGPGKNQVPSL
jgi:hypothetical protein